MAAIERKFSDCLINRYRWDQTKRGPCRLVHPEDFAFPGAARPTDTPFSSIFDFSAFEGATTHVFLWVCSLLLLQTMADVSHPTPTLRLYRVHRFARG